MIKLHSIVVSLDLTCFICFVGINETGHESSWDGGRSSLGVAVFGRKIATIVYSMLMIQVLSMFKQSFLFSDNLFFSHL